MIACRQGEQAGILQYITCHTKKLLLGHLMSHLMGHLIGQLISHTLGQIMFQFYYCSPRGSHNGSSYCYPTGSTHLT